MENTEEDSFGIQLEFKGRRVVIFSLVYIFLSSGVLGGGSFYECVMKPLG